jgi:hypothetical protein
MMHRKRADTQNFIMMRQSKKNFEEGKSQINAFFWGDGKKRVLAITIELNFFIAVLNYDETICRLILIKKSNKQWIKVINYETF